MRKHYPLLFFLLVIIAMGCGNSANKDVPELTTYHPFRSETARQRYLELYDERSREWPLPSDSRMVRTSYGETFVRVNGPEAAPPLVLLHGVGGNSLQWLPNVKALSGYYRVYAVDNIVDNGRSIYTKEISNSDGFAEWLDELFNALGLENDINLMGLSFGGWVNCQYALRHPEKINKIVLLAPAGTVLPLRFEWIARAVLCVIPHRYFTKSFMFWLLEDFVKSGSDNRAVAEKFVDEAFLAMKSFKRKGMVNPEVLTDEQWRRLKMPLLYLVGENEKIYDPQEAVRRLNGIAPNIRTKIIAEAGHDLSLVRAEEVNRLVLGFLNDD